MFATLETEMVKLLNKSDAALLECFKAHSIHELEVALTDVSAPRIWDPITRTLAHILDIDIDGHRQRFARLLSTAISSMR